MSVSVVYVILRDSHDACVWIAHRTPCKRARKHYRISSFYKCHLLWKEVGNHSSLRMEHE